MDGGLADCVRMAEQWLFGPLLALVALAWLCLRLEAAGTFDLICSAVRKMPGGRRFAFLALAAGLVAIAGTKTNSPPMNLPGPLLPPSVLVPVQPGLSPSSCGIPVPLPAEPFALPPEGTVTNFRWFLRGAFEDAVRIPFPDADGFPWHGGMATALTVFASGEFRPDAATAYFPAPFDAPLSLPPLSRRDPSAPSFFWHAATPSNSLITTWENGLYGRDLSHPTNLQAEFFADGSFVYRYPDRTTAYPPVLPFDWDGDGLENSVDPDPEAPGPDAHGTNAEWYGVVCSNILSATDGPYGVSLSWCDGASSNAYYFVDVVAERGPAPIYFTDAAGAVSGDPVVVALAGATNRVPLVIGPLYSVTSTVPFSISVAEDSIGRSPDGSVQVQPRDGGGYDVRWPVHFSYREESEGEFTVDSEPDGLELEFNWDVPGGVPAMNVQGFISPVLPGFSPLQLPRILGSPWACTCFQPCESNVVLTCAGNCGCGGCMLGGAVSHIGHTLALPTMTCGCPAPYDPDEPQEQHHDPSVPSFSVGFSASAVIYEDAYEDAPGVTVPKRSTEVVVDVSIYGGDKGGRFVINKMNFGRLLQTEPVNIPSGGTVDPNDTLIRNVTCIAAAPSTEEGDVSISGYFVENETGNRINCAASQLTVFKVELRPKHEAPDNSSQNRHSYGIGESITLNYAPTAATLDIDAPGWDVSNAVPIVLVCPLSPQSNQLQLEYAGVSYVPNVAIMAPTDIACTAVGFLPAMPVIGIGMALELRVRPMTVSFEGLSMQEEAADRNRPMDWGSRWGYFNNTNFIERWGHYTEWGAGVWRDVTQGNRWGVYDSSRMFDWPQPWDEGSMSWRIPVCWKRKGEAWQSIAGRFPADFDSVWNMTDSAVEKIKHGQNITLTSSGTVFINSERVENVSIP